MTTTAERYQAIERDINRIAEYLKQSITALEAQEHGDDLDETFESLKRRVLTLEKSVESLQQKIKLAKEVHGV